MNADIIQILVGIGAIAAIWRLNTTVGALTAEMKNYIQRTEDHEKRIRTLEKPTREALRIR